MKVKYESPKVRWFKSHKDEVRLNPSWQRGPVWSQSFRAMLIDSILKEYDIPKIYLWKRPPGGAHKFEVVDGQQRIRAVLGFMKDEFHLPENSEDKNGNDVGGLYFSELKGPTKTKFLDYTFTVVVISPKESLETVSHMFSRLQLGMSLNQPERRNALQTPLRQAIDVAARNHTFFESSRISAKRYKRQDYLAHLFTLIHRDGSTDLKAKIIAEDYKLVTVDEIFQIMDTIEQVLDILEIVNKESSLRLTQKWMFVDIGYWVYQQLLRKRKINESKLIKTYIGFNTDRLNNNINPEFLLKDSTPEEEDLYDYIVAFKLSGGLKKSIATRKRVIERRFKDCSKKGRVNVIST